MVDLVEILKSGLQVEQTSALVFALDFAKTAHVFHVFRVHCRSISAKLATQFNWCRFEQVNEQRLAASETPLVVVVETIGRLLEEFALALQFGGVGRQTVWILENRRSTD